MASWLRRGKLVALAVFALAVARGRGAESGPPFVLHEWGTFTFVVGSDGEPLAWRPLGGAPDLPAFVYERRAAARGFGGRSKGRMLALARMETPVVYFYADEELRLDVEVNFPSGLVTEWYPRATALGSGVCWDGVGLRPGAAPAFPEDLIASHYYAARATDAVPVSVGHGPAAQLERFLFYRGVGYVPLPLEVRLEAGAVVLARLPEAPGPGRALARGTAFVVEADAGQVGFTQARLSGGRARVPRPGALGAASAFYDALYARLLAAGLLPREASAMIETWRGQWVEDGLRVFYLLPQSSLDAILPLRVTPPPTEAIRVMVARVEVLTPEMEREALDLVERIGDGREDARSVAEALVAARGRFASALASRLARLAPPGPARARAARLLAEVEALDEDRAASS